MALPPVDLGPRLEAFVSRLVETGACESTDAVLRDAVRILQSREQRLTALDEAIDRGIADADAGRLESVDEVHDHLRETFDTLAATTRV